MINAYLVKLFKDNVTGRLDCITNEHSQLVSINNDNSSTERKVSYFLVAVSFHSSRIKKKLSGGTKIMTHIFSRRRLTKEEKNVFAS